MRHRQGADAAEARPRSKFVPWCDHLLARLGGIANASAWPSERLGQRRCENPLKQTQGFDEKNYLLAESTTDRGLEMGGERRERAEEGRRGGRRGSGG